MRSFISRPALLALTLVLIIGAIVFIETRLQTAAPEQQTAAASGQQTTVPQTNAPQTTSPPRTTQAQTEQSQNEASGKSVADKESEYPRAEEITDPTGFINTDGVSIGGARGNKVILLDFWTYTCINCQHTQPYLNAWQDRYADQGLEIIGVHRPEFGFEKDPANVEAAVRQAGIEYPVVLDNDSGTWDAYNQSYWPTMYLIDADGFIRYKHIGEGAYKDTEAEIQRLLTEKDRGES